MSTVFIPKSLRKRVAEQARHRCGYCLTTELLIGAPMEIEHIIPLALGGRTAIGRATSAALQLNRQQAQDLACQMTTAIAEARYWQQQAAQQVAAEDQRVRAAAETARQIALATADSQGALLFQAAAQAIQRRCGAAGEVPPVRVAAC